MSLLCLATWSLRAEAVDLRSERPEPPGYFCIVKLPCGTPPRYVPSTAATIRFGAFPTFTASLRAAPAYRRIICPGIAHAHILPVRRERHPVRPIARDLLRLHVIDVQAIVLSNLWLARVLSELNPETLLRVPSLFSLCERH